MGLHLKETSAKSGKVIFQKVLETARGGFTIDPSGLGLADDDVIPAGSPIEFNETTRLAKVLKTARAYETAGGSATDYKVEKGHILKVGDYLAGTVGAKAYAITAIDDSAELYDVVTVGTSIGAVTEGDALFQSSATGASAAALKVTGAQGLLYDDVIYAADASLSVVLRGTVYARRAPVPSAVKTALPLIIFSNSY